MADTITVKAAAKINLILDVVGKRPDGYHTLKSVFQSVGIYDELTFKITDTKKIVLRCDTEGIPTDGTNLAVKACDAFFRYSKKENPGLDIKLEKSIPSLAGMGGGSSDAAAAIKALNVLLKTEYSDDILCDIGEEVGADVPFCIVGGTVLCEGIGEILTPLPHMPECSIAVAKPKAAVSTPECFKKFDSLEFKEVKDISDMIACLAVSDVEGIGNNLFNSLEKAADIKEVKRIKEIMLSYEAYGACMTGSGSAVFGIFESKRDAKDCIKELEEFCPFTIVTKPVEKGIIVDD